MSFRFIIASILLMGVMFIMGLILTGIATMTAIGTVWMLAWMTSLTFSQTLQIGGVTFCFFLFIAQRSLRLGWRGTFMLAMMGTSMFVSAWALLASLIARYLPIEIDFWQAMLLCTAIGLVFLYGFAIKLEEESDELMSRLGAKPHEDEEDDEEEDHEEYEYDEEDDEYDDEEDEYDDEDHFASTNRGSGRGPKVASLEDAIEKWTLKAHEPCHCGSGKKFIRCHGRRDWR
ncbi:MAG: YecA family protein [Ardenticatenaceae bacterium]